MSKEELLESAWGIIANANGGDWDKATPEWKDAAIRWRDNYFTSIDNLSPNELLEDWGLNAKRPQQAS
jgi:hypothetical protein